MTPNLTKEEIKEMIFQSARQGLKPLANSESPLKWTEDFSKGFSRF